MAEKSSIKLYGIFNYNCACQQLIGKIKFFDLLICSSLINRLVLEKKRRFFCEEIKKGDLDSVTPQV